MTINKIIARARRMARIKDGLVLCDNCDNPASKLLSQSLSWAACGPCATGEADSLDYSDLISIGSVSEARLEESLDRAEKMLTETLTSMGIEVVEVIRSHPEYERKIQSEDRLTRHNLALELAGAVCRCSRPKLRSKTFCVACFTSLPQYLRGFLYRRIGNGYEEAYGNAVEFLDAQKQKATR